VEKNAKCSIYKRGSTAIDDSTPKGHNRSMWKPDWDAISTRIAGIIDASTFLFTTKENDSAYSTNILIENCKETAGAVSSLVSRYDEALPPKVREALSRFQN
jgi:hypothetical protein